MGGSFAAGSYHNQALPSGRESVQDHAMQKRAAGTISGILFTVVIPTVVGMMIPQIEPAVGLTIIAVSGLLGLVIVGWAYWPRRSPSAAAPINKPLKHWFDIGTAPFKLPLLPQFKAQGNFWDEDTLRYYLGEWEDGEFTNCKGVAFDRGVVDRKNGWFMYYWADGTGVGDRPWLIGDLNEGGFVSIPPAAADTIRRGAAKAWELMNEPLQQHLEEGRLRVWARVGSPMAPFSPIPADSWRHYSVEDWARGEAKAAGEDRLYSVHFEPLSPSEGPEPPRPKDTGRWASMAPNARKSLARLTVCSTASRSATSRSNSRRLASTWPAISRCFSRSPATKEGRL